jgi:hypothetical protein
MKARSLRCAQSDKSGPGDQRYSTNSAEDLLKRDGLCIAQATRERGRHSARFVCLCQRLDRLGDCIRAMWSQLREATPSNVPEAS